MSDVIPIPTKESLADGDLHEVRWLEAAFVEANYTVEYANYVQHHRVVESLASGLRSRANATVLDLGCADGRSLFALHRRLKRPGIRYVGVDLDRQSLISAAKRIAHRNYTNFELRFGDVTQTGLPSAFADVVLASEVAEHLLQPRLLFEEIWRLLKPGGQAVVTTPNLSNYPLRMGRWIDRRLGGRLRTAVYTEMAEKAEYTGFTTHEGTLGHVSQQPARAWEELAEQVGFQVRLERASTLVYGYPWLARHPVLFGLLCLVDSVLEWCPRWVDTSHDVLIVLGKGRAP